MTCAYVLVLGVLPVEYLLQMMHYTQAKDLNNYLVPLHCTRSTTECGKYNGTPTASLMLVKSIVTSPSQLSPGFPLRNPPRETPSSDTFLAVLEVLRRPILREGPFRRFQL